MSLDNFSVSNLPSVYFDGQFRVLGCIPSDPNSGLPMFGSSHAVLPESEWRELDLQHFSLPIKDQGMYSSCVGFSASSCMEMAWAQSGRPKTLFSPWFIYSHINGGRDAGARISDALMELKGRGVCPDADVPSGTIQQSRISQKAYENARRFRIEEAYQCASFTEIASALSLGFPVVLGILVGSNFPQLDAEGVAPLPAGGGGGHALLGVGLQKSSRYGWVIKVQNSWGQNFGRAGHCFLRREHFKAMNPDAFAIQAIFDDPLDDSPQDEVPTVLGGEELSVC